MLLVKTPDIVRLLLPQFLWRMPAREKILYLTFDDGPIPEVTPWVLEELKQRNALATFFCVGDNVRKHPEVYRQILENGHQTGNHTYNHLNGWKTSRHRYLDNIEKCRQILPSRLFRPPYGCITPAQARMLKTGYKIVMWDVISGDFDQRISPEQCLKNVTGNAQPGSVVVLHDSLKAERNLRYSLPLMLDHFVEKGYRFETLGTFD